jgi:cyclic pyranopterin monophosphate synthase
MSTFSHFDEQGASRMVDVGSKPESERTAQASGLVKLAAETVALIRDRKLAKGDVLEVARIAGIQAAKRTGELIPLCHPLAISAVQVDFSFVDDTSIRIESLVKIIGRTGVEMEALTAVSVAALTIYDMVKSVDRGVVIQSIQLEGKTGGVRGDWKR